jgi:hypothetical protein
LTSDEIKEQILKQPPPRVDLVTRPGEIVTIDQRDYATYIDVVAPMTFYLNGEKVVEKANMRFCLTIEN